MPTYNKNPEAVLASLPSNTALLKLMELKRHFDNRPLIADFPKETSMTPEAKSVTPTVFYRTLNVEGLEIFYRGRSPGCSHRSALARLSVASHMFFNRFLCLRINIMSLPQTSLDMAKAQHRRSTISTIPTNG